MSRPGWLLAVVVLAVPLNNARAESPLPDEARLRAMTSRFAAVEIGADLSRLP